MTPEDEEFNRIEREADMRLQAVSAVVQSHAARPVVPDALTSRDGESPEYMAGWNDCRAEMLRWRKS
jgi:hypothetical protein